MREQFDKAHPFVAYPVVTVTPDGGLVVAAGDTMVRRGAGGAWACGHSLTQSISINQSIIQSINQSINQSID